MKQNVYVPLTFLFLTWHVRYADASCAPNTYKAKDFLDVIAMDQPYIVSDASDWNAGHERFDSNCGGEVCAGGTGYVEKFTDTKTFALRSQHYVRPKFGVKPPAGYFADSVPPPSHVAGAWEWGNGGYVSFGSTQFLATPVGLEVTCHLAPSG